MIKKIKRNHVITVGDWVYRRATYVDNGYTPVIGRVMSRLPGGLRLVRWSGCPAGGSEENSYESLRDLVFWCDCYGKRNKREKSSTCDR